MKPLLANPALKPSAADVQSASAQAQALLKLRFSSPLFRLGSADAINAKVSFPVSGSADAHQGVIVMRVDDTVGADVDPALKGLVVVFNGSGAAVDQLLPGMTGAGLALSPVQSAGADAVVKTSRWDSSTSTLSVPPGRWPSSSSSDPSTSAPVGQPAPCPHSGGRSTGRGQR